MAVDIWGIGHCCQDNICVVEQYPPEDGSTHILEIDDSQGGERRPPPWLQRPGWGPGRA